jgi:hypothetical protein
MVRITKRKNDFLSEIENEPVIVTPAKKSHKKGKYEIEGEEDEEFEFEATPKKSQSQGSSRDEHSSVDFFNSLRVAPMSLLNASSFAGRSVYRSDTTHVQRFFINSILMGIVVFGQTFHLKDMIRGPIFGGKFTVDFLLRQ